MAIAREGSSQVDASGGNGSTSVTVPSGATIAVAFWSHWDNGTGTSLSALTLNGDAFTIPTQVAEGDPTSEHNGMGVGYLVLPDTGSQTLAWTWSGGGARQEGGELVVVFYSGIDTSDPVRDSDYDHETMTTDVSVTIDTTTTDMVAAFAMGYDGAPAITDFTTFIDATLNAQLYTVAEKLGSATSTTVAMTNEFYSGMAAISLKEGSTTITATASFTEPNETVSASATHPVTGSATFTEANETVSASASHPVIGTADFTEPNETIGSAVTVQWFANAAFTEPNETLSGAADHPVIGNALESDEPNETLSSDAVVLNVGVVDVTEADETLSSDATVEGGVTGAADFTEPNEVLTGAATVLVTPSLSVTEPLETLSSDVTHPVIGTAEFTEAGETLSAAGTVVTIGAAAFTEANETLSSEASHPVLGTALQNTEANESLTGEATVAIVASFNATEPNETLSSLTGVVVVADADFTEPNERLSSLVDTGTGFVYGSHRSISMGIRIGL